MSDTQRCQYNYANKCDCAEDDKCGCDYPNNLQHDFSLACLTTKQINDIATETPMTTSAFDTPSNNQKSNKKTNP